MTEESGVPAPRPTGSLETTPSGLRLVLTRTFGASVDDVWTSVAEPDGLGRWIGTWEGDPASGHVLFVMTAEGATEGEECRILRCEPPRRLAVETSVGEAAWRLEIELAEVAGVTTMTFRQALGPADDASGIGPGWEYYLDRLVAARAGRDPAEVEWDRYYPALATHYGAADETA
jgi:uncharacterized protein YndB with AHSA1/START domain